jgi:hypothetical protein
MTTFTTAYVACVVYPTLGYEYIHSRPDVTSHLAEHILAVGGHLVRKVACARCGPMQYYMLGYAEAGNWCGHYGEEVWQLEYGMDMKQLLDAIMVRVHA